MNDVDVLGPVDYLVVEFPADKANFSGELAAALRDLVERGVARVLDLSCPGRSRMDPSRRLSCTSSTTARSASCASSRVTSVAERPVLDLRSTEQRR
jgi:hypothetical protein